VSVSPPDPARSAIMRAVKGRDTGPELIVRRLLHGLGYRYRLYGAKLPGTPDLVFAGRRKVIFVHGCFWHGHDCKRGARMPRRNTEYWTAKIARNRARDALVKARLSETGWSSWTTWECELKDRERLTKSLCVFLGPPRI
jgi:DNA mismatch endonuclease, patch repair protein